MYFHFLMSIKRLKMSHDKHLLWFTLQASKNLSFLYSPLTMSQCLMKNFSPLPTHPSFIFLYLRPLSSPPTSDFAPDEPGQLKIYLPKKLLECLPKCSSLPKERHRWNTNEVRMRHTQEGNICDSETNSVFSAGDSSLANVTLRDEEEVNKHNGSFSLWDTKTVTPRNKKGTKSQKIPLTVHSLFLFHFVIQTALCKGVGIRGAWV